MPKSKRAFHFHRPVSRRGFLVGTAAVALTSPVAARTARTLAAQAHAQDQAHEGAEAFHPDLEFIALSRLTYGSTPSLRKHYQGLGPTPEKRWHAFVEEQLHPERMQDKLCEEKIKNSKFESLNLSLEDAYQKYIVKVDQQKDAEKKATSSAAPATAKVPGGPMVDENKIRLTVAAEVEQATWLRAVYSERQLFERVVEFWHDHFNVYAFDQKISPTFAVFDRDVIRAQAFGNFRQMLEAVAQSPAMLIYLDNTLNQSGNPNENYARELFELHTLGAENYLGTMDRDKVKGFSHHTPIGYVDGDVYEAARCFTGWRIDQGGNSKNTGTFVYFEPWHDRFQKIVLGHGISEHQPPLKDGRDVLDYLSTHTGTSRYIARKLCRRFVCDEPSDAFVDRIAHAFREHHQAPDQIKRVLKEIIVSEEFRSTWGKKLKRPFESTVQLVRAATSDFRPSQPFLQNFEKTGQRRFGCRTPDGYADTLEKWASPNSLLERWRSTNQLLLGKLDSVTISEDWTKIARETAKGLTDKEREENGRLFVQRVAQDMLGRNLLPSEMNAVVKILLATPQDWTKSYSLVASTIFLTPTSQRC